MDPNAPDSSLELDPTRTELISVSTPPATAVAVIHPNPFIEKEEKNEPKDRKKVRPRGKLRSDHDRPRHMSNARGIRKHLATAREPLVAQSLEAMERIHRVFSRQKLAERKVAAEWKVARQDLHAAMEQASQLVAYCARKVRISDEDNWFRMPEVDAAAAEAREKELLKGFLPSELREPSNLSETLEHLGRVLTEDPAEVGRWNPHYVEAVRQCATALRASLDAAKELKNDHGIAMKRLRRARGQWDLCWSVFERLVLGWFDLLGRKDEVIKAFDPIRLRGSPRLNGKEPPESG